MIVEFDRSFSKSLDKIKDKKIPIDKEEREIEVQNNAGASLQNKVARGFNISIKSISHIMELERENRLPEKIMLITHPHRWFDPDPVWLKELLLRSTTEKELVMQNIKNVVKQYIVKRVEKRRS